MAVHAGFAQLAVWLPTFGEVILAYAMVHTRIRTISLVRVLVPR